MHIILLIAAYSGVVAIASMLGGELPRLVRMTHLRTQLLISFVAGLMLAIAAFQMLPHSIEQLGSASWTGGAVLVGILVMFLMLRAFHVHPHAASPLSVDPANDARAHLCEHAPAAGGEVVVADGQHLRSKPGGEHEHEHEHEHGHGHGHPATVAAAGGHPDRMLSWIGIAVGLGVHSLMDGVAMAASVVADAEHGAWLGLFGFGTFLAIGLHKPLDAFAITSTMQASGWPEQHQRAVNLAFSLLSPIGAVSFWAGANMLGMEGWVVGLSLAVAAGFFICIALADLLPEVHFHSHDRLALTTALLLGVVIAVGIESLPGHDHEAHQRSAPDGSSGTPEPRP